jgi:hypothetical protein
MRIIRSIFAVALLSVFLLATGAVAEEKPSATLEMTSKSVAVGVGFTWGSGTLKVKGQEHHFSIKGLSIVDVGVTKLSVVGEVYHLDKLESFNGTYVAASAGAVIAGGAEFTVMKNQNGVFIKMKSTQKGLKLKLAPEGVTLTLK